MVTESIGRVALMSIHPKYAHAILSGQKKVEFRKRPLAADVTHVVIYSTVPDRAVLGYFSISDQHLLTPDELWERFSGCGSIGREEFFDYYSGRQSGVGIGVKSVTKLGKALDLAEDLGVSAAPQSYQYLSVQSMEIVRSAAR